MEFANWVLQQDGWLFDYRNPSHGPPEELNTAIALPVGISRPALSLFARLSDAIKRRDEAELDVLALRAVGALGYDSLSRTGREVWDRWEREHCLVEVAATLASISDRGGTLRGFLEIHILHVAPVRPASLASSASILDLVAGTCTGHWRTTSSPPTDRYSPFPNSPPNQPPSQSQ